MEKIEELKAEIAENPEEAFWISMKKKCEQSIEQCDHEKEIQNHILELSKTHIKE